MKLIYQNFDKLEVSFQGALPEVLLYALKEAKEKAAEETRSVLTSLNGIDVHVREIGAKGGYAYQFSTGDDGEVWFIKHNTKPNEWNLRINISSLALALYGYKAAIARVYDRLETLGVKGSNRYDSDLKESTTEPLSSIARVDYCFDFITDDFIPNGEHLRSHSHCKRNKHYGELDEDSQGRSIQTIRVGKMPNRQVILYNKSLEIAEKGKNYWWQLWGIKPKANQTVWRVEVRAGKEELKKWNLRTFADFRVKIGNVVLHILNNIRYVKPLEQDTNVSRWPNADFWDVCIKSTKNVLAPHISNISRNAVMEVMKSEKIANYHNQIYGNIAGLAAMLNSDPKYFEEVVWEIVAEIFDTARSCPSKLFKRYREVSERYHFLDA